MSNKLYEAKKNTPSNEAKKASLSKEMESILNNYNGVQKAVSSLVSYGVDAPKSAANDNYEVLRSSKVGTYFSSNAPVKGSESNDNSSSADGKDLEGKVKEAA